MASAELHRPFATQLGHLPPATLPGSLTLYCQAIWHTQLRPGQPFTETPRAAPNMCLYGYTSSCTNLCIADPKSVCFRPFTGTSMTIPHKKDQK
jgi:hypothetical protein